MTAVAGKRQVTPSLVDVASFAERLGKLVVTGDRAKPVSSNLAHARTAAKSTADAAADARHEAAVPRAYITLGLNDIARISTLPFPASASKAAGAQQLEWRIPGTQKENSRLSYPLPAQIKTFERTPRATHCVDLALTLTAVSGRPSSVDAFRVCHLCANGARTKRYE